MEIADYLDQIDAHGDGLLAAAEQAGFDSGVPSCPDWTVRDLVIHLGGVYRWAADLVGAGRTEFTTEAGAAVGTGPGDDALIGWVREGREDLVATLRSAPDDLACFTLWPVEDAARFWARRQAHETAIHRVDAEAAGSLSSAFDDTFATDGIEEMLHGFARRTKAYPPTSIGLVTPGRSWQVTMGEGGVTAGPAESPEATAGSDVTVSGRASDLYRWLWNRPASVNVSGDPAAATRWEQIRVRWA